MGNYRYAFQQVATSPDSLAKQCVRHGLWGHPCPVGVFLCPIYDHDNSKQCVDVIAEDWQELMKGMKP